MTNGRLKAWFLSASIAVTSVLGLGALWQAAQQQPLWPWVWAAVAALAYPLRIGSYYIIGQRTTKPLMPGLLAVSALGFVMCAVTVAMQGAPIALLPAVAGPVCALGYVFWYSRLHRGHSKRIAAGEQIPDVEFLDTDGKTLTSGALSASRVLYMFYRGNWCPLCMAQIREVAGLYRELDKRGVKVALVSPQPHENTKSLAARFDVPMLFLTDPGLAAARALGIVHAGGLPATFEVLGYDQDTVLPTVVLVEKGGRILFSDETDNYRVRPEPALFLKLIDQADAGVRVAVPAADAGLPTGTRPS